jgi:hypothetical protein
MFKDDYTDWCPWKDAKTDVYEYTNSNTKPNWCPLESAPKKSNMWWRDDMDDWETGYNACVREILRGKD